MNIEESPIQWAFLFLRAKAPILIQRHEAAKDAGKTATNIEAEPAKCEVEIGGKGGEEVQGEGVRHGEKGGGKEGGEEGRKLDENHPKMKGQEAREAIGGSNKDIEVEPAKHGRPKHQKRQRQSLYPIFTHFTKSSSKTREGGDGSGGAKVGATGEVVTGAKEETSRGSLEEPRDEKGYGGFRVEEWDPGSRTAGQNSGLTD